MPKHPLDIELADFADRSEGDLTEREAQIQGHILHCRWCRLKVLRLLLDNAEP
jgi:hypothetical protein